MRAILIFVATCYGLSSALSLVIGLSGGQDSAFVGLAYLSMFLPAGAVVIVSAIRNEPPRVRMSRDSMAGPAVPGSQRGYQSEQRASARQRLQRRDDVGTQ
jgi:NH3-dependent NAD+ synthetase